MANEQLRERLARYIDPYKDDKESGVNMGTVGLAMVCPSRFRGQ